MWHRIGRRRLVRRLGVLAVAVAAALSVVAVVRQLDRPEPFPSRVSTELEGSRRQDGSVPLQTVWNIRFEGAELRVFRDEASVLRCPGSPGCTRSDRGGTVAFRIDAPGEYRALALTRPGPGPGTALSATLRAAGDEENPVRMSSPLIAY